MDAHSQNKKKKLRKEKTRNGIPALAETMRPPPRRDASKKKTVHKRHRRPIKYLNFHTEDSPRFQNNASNKTIARHNPLSLDLGFEM
jgi:hypothetical protein